MYRIQGIKIGEKKWQRLPGLIKFRSSSLALAMMKEKHELGVGYKKLRVINLKTKEVLKVKKILS